MSTHVTTPEEIRQAAAQLHALLPTGRLHFISSLHLCQRPPGLIQTAAAQDECHRWARMHDDGIFSQNLLADPRHFLCVPISELRGPNIAGVMIAKTARGDRQIGQAPALLARLTRYDAVMAESRARLANAERDKGLIVPVHAGL